MSHRRDAGAMAQDAMNHAVPEWTDFTMFDDAGTLYSPIVAGTSEIALTAPKQAKGTPGAWKLMVRPMTADIQLRGASGIDSSGLATIDVASWFEVPCYPGCTRYFKRPTSTAVEFIFMKLALGTV